MAEVEDSESDPALSGEGDGYSLLLMSLSTWIRPFAGSFVDDPLLAKRPPPPRSTVFPRATRGDAKSVPPVFKVTDEGLGEVPPPLRRSICFLWKDETPSPRRPAFPAPLVPEGAAAEPEATLRLESTGEGGEGG